MRARITIREEGEDDKTYSWVDTLSQEDIDDGCSVPRNGKWKVNDAPNVPGDSYAFGILEAAYQSDMLPLFCFEGDQTTMTIEVEVLE